MVAGMRIAVKSPPSVSAPPAKSEAVGAVAMIICSCNVLSDHEVKIAVAASKPLRTVGRLFLYLGCAAQCGRCAQSIKRIMDATDHPIDAQQISDPAISSPLPE
jgi:bacterioferritin-associated ferredoxin